MATKVTPFVRPDGPGDALSKARATIRALEAEQAHEVLLAINVARQLAEEAAQGNSLSKTAEFSLIAAQLGSMAERLSGRIPRG